MKKTFILLITLFFITGCSKEIKFEVSNKDITRFHQISAAEKIEDGTLYYIGENVFYDKENTTTKIASNVQSIWRENQDIYYNSNDILYNYNLKTKKTKKMVENPYIILGKYKDSIISYHGKNIYAIKDNKKTKILEDGYYLNDAVLYKNKVYGIPSSNVYEYNLDTLEINKLTNNKQNTISEFIKTEDDIYIRTYKYTNLIADQVDYIYSKLTDKGLIEIVTLKKISEITSEKIVKGGIVIGIQNNIDESTKKNKLFYINNDRVKTIDKDYSYEIVGIFDQKLLYYKNSHSPLTGGKNLKTFYLYNGKKSSKEFELDVGDYTEIRGEEYENGILISIVYESTTKLYNYDGTYIKKIDTPDNFQGISGIDIIDKKAYIRYMDGEDALYLGTIIDLK